MTAKGDAENFERGVTGNARQQRRRLDAVTLAAVMEDDFLRLGRIQRQIDYTLQRTLFTDLCFAGITVLFITEPV